MTNLTTVYDGTDASELDPERLETFIATIEARVADGVVAELVIARDFVRAVRSRTTDAQEREEYDANRLFGMAVARTFGPTCQHGPLVVVDASLLRPVGGAPLETVRRLGAHEAYHVVIHQRSECVTDLRRRRRIDGYTRLGYFIECAGIAAEEFRVEAALAADGLDLEESYRADLPASLVRLQAAVLDGVSLRYPSESMERPARTVMQAFHRFTILCSYLAAERRADIPPVLKAPLGRRLVDGHFAAFKGALSTIPSANEPTLRDAVDRYVETLVQPLDDWLRHIGFAVEDRPEGLYFDVLRHDWHAFAALTA